jgi:hypothetical protein
LASALLLLALVIAMRTLAMTTPVNQSARAQD